MSNPHQPAPVGLEWGPPVPASLADRGALLELPESMRSPRPLVVRGPVAPPPPPSGMAYPPGGLLFIPWALVPPDVTVTA